MSWITNLNFDDTVSLYNERSFNKRFCRIGSQLQLAKRIDDRERQIPEYMGSGGPSKMWPCELRGEVKNPRAARTALIDTCCLDSMGICVQSAPFKARSLGESYTTFRDSSALCVCNVVPRKAINGSLHMTPAQDPCVSRWALFRGFTPYEEIAQFCKAKIF